MGKDIQQLEKELLDLQNKVKTYSNLEKKIKDNYEKVDIQRQKLISLDNKIIDSKEQLNATKENNKGYEVKIEINIKEIKEQEEKIIKLGKDISSAKEYLVKLEQKYITKEQELQDIQRLQIIQIDNLEKKLLKIEKEHKISLSRIQDEINKEEQYLTNIQDNIVTKEDLIKQAEKNYEIINIELRGLKHNIKQLRKEEEELVSKNTILKQEIQEMLKQSKEYAIKHKITKSWAERLSALNNKFKS